MHDAPSNIILIGEGVLQKAVRQALVPRWNLAAMTPEALDSASLGQTALISVSDSWQPDLDQRLNAFSVTKGIPWLRVYLAFGVGIVGPWVRPGIPGCVRCAELRELLAREDGPQFLQLRERIGQQPSSSARSWLTGASATILAQAVVADLIALEEQPDVLRMHQALFRLRLDTLACSLQRFFPDPNCGACGRLPDDTAEAAIIALQPCLKLSPSTYRVRALVAEKEQLLKTYVNPVNGIIRGLNLDTSNLYANSVAALGVRGGSSTENGVGRSLNYAASQVGAVAEALERHAGMRPGGKRTLTRSSYNQLGDRALDPTTLGLPPDAEYNRPHYRYERYHHDLVCTWIWGYSFRRQQPILVPEHYAYYGLQHYTHAKTFVYETSNGCALGSCLEEAIFYGILEVMERDAFLMTWYARLGVAGLDLRSVRDRSIRLMIERAERMTGYTFYAYNITLDHAAPCCWVMAVDEQNWPLTPKALCAAGAHPDPERALQSALQELVSMVVDFRKIYPKQREHALPMLADPYAVRQMQDHPLLYCLPEAFDRLSFLYHTPRIQTFEEAFSDGYQPAPSLELTVDLRRLIHWYLDQGLDIVVVDQTAQEHAAAGFHCVKAIIPGMLPITFGYQTRRLANLERLYHVPHRLGYYPQPLTTAELHDLPHPFF